MADFKISRFRYTYKGNWVTGTAYKIDDIVRYGGSSYVCLRGHTASADFYTDVNYVVPGSSPAVPAPAWTVMTKGVAWRRNWATSTQYNVGDVVNYEGHAYVCITGHQSSSTFAPNNAKWEDYVVGERWVGDWTSNTRYGVGDLVKYGGSVYECATEHTSSTRLEVGANHLKIHGTVKSGDIDYVVFTVGASDITALYLTKYVGVDQIAFYAIQQGSTYTAGTNTSLMHVYGHFGPATIGNAVGDNILNVSGSAYKPLLANTTYTMWIQNASANITEYIFSTDPTYVGTAEALPLDYSGDPLNPTRINYEGANWKFYYSGVDVFNTWSNGVDYKLNDLVKHGGSIWRCVTGHVGGPSFITDYWEIELPGYQFGEEWTNATYYQIGDIVRYGGDLYYSSINNNDINPKDASDSTVTWVKLAKGYNLLGDWNQGTAYRPGDVVRRGGYLYVCLIDNENDGSSFDYLEPSTWAPLVPGYKWQGQWDNGVSYALNDLVIYKGNTYYCLLAHVSDETSFPGDNGSIAGLWEVYVWGGDYISMTNVGDMPTFDLSRTAAGDGSSIGPTGIPIGTEDQILDVNVTGSARYKTYGSFTLARFVAPNGVDRSDYGDSPYRPWKTIRYSCEQIESLNAFVKLTVFPGTYEEVLPIIVPAGCAIKGEEVRSVTVKPNQPIAALAGDATYTIAVLNRIQTILFDLVLGNTITVTTGNTVTQNKTSIGNSTAVASVSGLIDDIIQYINFYINSIGTDVTVTGTNTATTVLGYAETVEALEKNKEFLAAEAVAYMQYTYPTYDFDTVSCKRDVRAFIDAWKYDITYTGNYKSVLAARYYRNAVLGSVTDDMFYVRDACGIRNMTLSGLTGTLNPLGVYDFYQRPTGGSYVSLDPGWGPDDDRTWITTRSTYVQNVTTFGYAATGQKIDGALHNGGNKSIVSNDFTQVISDGIGAHVLNGGRAELVSVFTYYSQVGYLAENGGIIRATNGNNSYGVYGAMALGLDDSEVPLSGSVNTRNNQAQVYVAFSGNLDTTTDAVHLLEFTNCGQNYTTASYTFTGAGTGISVIQEDIRDQAVMSPVIYNPEDSGASGGGGFTNIIANAQSGTSTTIKLSGTDNNVEAEYLGMRVIIISGDGCGQYGYISAYNSSTKVASISKESNDTAGWDHVIPGWPIATALGPSARYSIEPRPIWEAPSFSTSTIALPTESSWSNVIFGETSATYTNIEGDVGTGTTDETIAPVTAVFTVTRNGRSYGVTITNTGAGYEAGQYITLLGSELGGIDGDNDIIIRVTEVSEDSTNSIVSFTFKGQSVSGKFVAVTSGNSYAAYSSDGISWTSTTLPSSGSWTALASGNGKFLAVKSNSNQAATSTDGITWTSRTLPASRLWTAAAYGNSTFVVIASNLNSAAYSSDGITWNSATMPTFGDSSLNTWVDVCWGRNKFYAIANTGNTGAYSSDGITWTGILVDATNDSSQVDWVSIAYGNGRFMVISDKGDVGYSFDGEVWYQGTNLPSPDGSTKMHWNKLRYGQGVFFAVCDTGSQLVGADTTTGPTTYAATSEDGVTWTEVTLASAKNWTSVAFGNPNTALGDSTDFNNVGTWVAVSTDTTTGGVVAYTGARAKGRVTVTSGRISRVILWNPGSGYTVEPALTLTDPNNTSEVAVLNRLGSGVLGQPTFLNRGIGYRQNTTTVTVSGDGYADITPSGKYITISELDHIPGPGAQINFDGIATNYRLVTVTQLEDLKQDGKFNIFCQVSPTLDTELFITHDSGVTIREQYSSCRITGHDFLDIGTGNFIETNYPELYGNATFFSAPENEVYEGDGGRVFYTSTDQNGNFRTGELFAVEQATGIVTISADFFDLAGLTELRLGGVRLGGSSVIVREFSTDPLFSEDSNNIVPTQRAIKAYLASRLSVAGSDLVANAFTAGEIYVGGANNEITNILSKKINFPNKINFNGPQAGVTGAMVAQAMFYRSFIDDV